VKKSERNVRGNTQRNKMAMVLAGGKGERLSPLTENKPKP